ncbi:MAG: hypothetical protein U9Q82_08280, partial [Chloroflexota bacterium]|nr:hypothetical protein [Chloroflexota bacterium]
MHSRIVIRVLARRELNRPARLLQHRAVDWVIHRINSRLVCEIHLRGLVWIGVDWWPVSIKIAGAGLHIEIAGAGLLTVRRYLPIINNLLQ